MDRAQGNLGQLGSHSRRLLWPSMLDLVLPGTTMFNEVIVKCPNCRALMGLHSSAGSCNGESHALEEADTRDVVAVMDKVTACYKCGTRYKVLSLIYRDIEEVHNG